MAERRTFLIEARPEADIVLRPRLTGISSADFAARKRSIAAGREMGLAMLGEMKGKIAAKTR